MYHMTPTSITLLACGQHVQCMVASTLSLSPSTEVDSLKLADIVCTGTTGDSLD